MKIRLVPSLAFLLLVTFFSCQKELSFENSANPAQGSLQSDATAECLPKTIAGAFVAGTTLTASNYIDVTIDVTTLGSYSIRTDTSNGYSFKGSGTFTALGLNTVRLLGAGKPIVDGTDLFIVTFDSTFCLLQVPVLPAGAGGPAVFTLSGSGATCLDFAVSGTYVKGVALTGTNNVAIKVDVTTIGTYTITTTAVNGMTFSGTGTFSSPGVQLVTLNGAGIPANSGAIVVTLTAGSSTCTFTVNVSDTPPPPPSNDYFPRTANSNWSYDIDGDVNDSIYRRTISATHTVSGNVFNIFMATDNVASGYDSSGYYRRAGGDYNEWIDLGGYLGLDGPSWVEYTILKDNQAVGHTWQSPQISGTSSGTPITLRIEFKILQKDITFSVKGIPYANTIVVEEKYWVFSAGTWVDATSGVGYYKNYYARGIGLIKWEYIDPDPTVPIDQVFELRRHQVF